MSPGVVGLKLTGGLVEAEGMEISDGGKVMVFTGRVRTTFTAPPPEGAVARQASAEPSSVRP